MKKAFTLSEAIIVLAILGIVAALVIPQVVRRHIEASNRAKIKKSMTVYDFLISKIVMENDLRSQELMQAWGSENNCANPKKYFKIAKVDDENPCKFQTNDKVWWDISDILEPEITVEEPGGESNPLNFEAMYDPNIGNFRVNDLAYANTADKAKAVKIKKLYDYLNNVKEEKTCDHICQFKRGDFDNIETCTSSFFGCWVTTVSTGNRLGKTLFLNNSSQNYIQVIYNNDDSLYSITYKGEDSYKECSGSDGKCKCATRDNGTWSEYYDCE